VAGYISIEGFPCQPGPLLTEACEEQTKKEASKKESKEENPPSAIPCDQCGAIPTHPAAEANIAAKPKVTINVPATAKDGDTVTFSATVQGGMPTSYQWSYEAPSGAGNNPQVNFTAPTNANTNANAHWFAKPDSACPRSSTESTYKIKVTATFANIPPITKEKSFKVTVLWDPAGVTNAMPTLGGYPTLAQTSPGVWTVTGMGNLTYIPNITKTINVPPSSQFFSKIDEHENVHVQQWQVNGLTGQNFDPSLFYNRISGFSAATQARLVQLINAEVKLFYKDATNAANASCNQSEIAAYNISDLLNPMYLYQRCSRTTFSNCPGGN
jgi:hypothetical protein